jgi:hypothetical protein
MVSLTGNNLPILVSRIGSFRPQLPWSINLSSSYLVPYSPFRLYAGIVYRPDEIFKTELPENIGIRNLSFLRTGLEIKIGQPIRLYAGYDLRTRSQFVYEDFKGLTGFSMGLMLRLKKAAFTYGYSQITPAYGYSQIGLNFRINKLQAL